MSVIIMAKFNTKKISEHVLIHSSIKWGAHAIDPNDRRAAENALVHAVAMNVILHEYAGWNGRPVGWVGSREPHVLTAEVVVVASEADGMFRPIEWFPQVLSDWLRGDGWWLFELDGVN